MRVKKRTRSLTLPAIAATALALAGCASSSGPHLSGDYTARHHGGIRYQIQPYQINGVWYYPKADYSYDETGTASWYGSQFQGRATSDGETFDMNEVSAAHKTLPLPSVVEVTNLQNGRSLQLRVNDRGPFVDGRIIDLSRRAAQLLGYETAGTAQVRVRILRDESIKVAEEAMHGQAPRIMVAQIPAAAVPAVAAYAPQAPARPAPVFAQAPVQAAEQPASLRAPVVVASTPRPNPPETRIPETRMPETRMAEAPTIEPAAVETQRFEAEPPLPPPRRRFAAAPAPIIIPRDEPPPPRMAAQAPRHRWPSLISEAHADTLHLPLAPASMPAHKPVPATAGGMSRIFVQAGAFAVPENAQRARAQIAALGSVEVVPASSGRGGPLYKVRLGPLASEAEAARLLNRLAESGYPGARVVGE